jgi:tungstate transport system ATP-binding protein
LFTGIRAEGGKRVTAVVAVDGLRKTYGGRLVLDVERLDLQPGEILALMGPSGSGKTTLLRLLATLEEPDEGEVRFAGLVFRGRTSLGSSGRPPAGTGTVKEEAGGLSGSEILTWRRRLAFVSQNPVLFTGRVADNVSLGLNFRGLAGQAAKEAVEQALEGVGLEAFAGARVETLSAGEAQRVALARALVTRPQALFLDEPTANLDPANVNLIERALRKAVETWQPAVLFVTHDLFQARRVGRRCGVIVAGRLVETGETSSVFERPADPRTAAFVRGEMVC